MLKKIIAKIKRIRGLKSSEAFVKYLRNKGIRIGDNTVFLSPRRTFIDENRAEWIVFGKDCVICRNTTFLAHDYSWSVLIKSHETFLPTGGGEVKICNNVFIGEGSTILRNVTIGCNTIIGANSVVTHNIPENSVACGNPAKVIMTLEEFKAKREATLINEAKSNYVFLKKKNGFVSENHMRNFRPLYIKRDLGIIDKYCRDNKIIGIDSEKLKHILLTSSPKFKSYDEFIDYIQIN